MAIQNQSVASVEHDFYVTRSGLVASVSLNEAKAKYFSDQGFGGNASIHKPISQMEAEWLASQTGVTSVNPQDQWREAVAGLGIAPENSVDQNKRTFLLNLP